jgi:addiction module RelE/StbE family toxin
MARYKVVLAEPAKNDLQKIAHYISLELGEPETASRVNKTLREAISSLSDSPRKYPPVTDEQLARRGYRKLLVKNYIAFFTVDEQSGTVNVERVLYTRRDWANLIT